MKLQLPNWCRWVFGRKKISHKHASFILVGIFFLFFFLKRGCGAAVSMLCSILTPLSAGRFFGVKECHNAGDKKLYLMNRSRKINGAQKISSTRTKGENEVMNRGESAALPSRHFHEHGVALLEKRGAGPTSPLSQCVIQPTLMSHYACWYIVPYTMT